MKMKLTNKIKSCTPKYLIMVIDNTNVSNFLFSPSLITESPRKHFIHSWNIATSGMKATNFI